MSAAVPARCPHWFRPARLEIDRLLRQFGQGLTRRGLCERFAPVRLCTHAARGRCMLPLHWLAGSATRSPSILIGYRTTPPPPSLSDVPGKCRRNYVGPKNHQRQRLSIGRVGPSSVMVPPLRGDHCTSESAPSLKNQRCRLAKGLQLSAGYRRASADYKPLSNFGATL